VKSAASDGIATQRARPAGGAGPDSSISGWLASLQQLFPIPETYRVQDVDWRKALDVLRCGEDVLSELIDNGLPSSGAAGEARFDRHDLFNLALYSGSERSVPELAFGFALRWMGEPATSWFEPKHWEVHLALSCGRPDGCANDPSFTLARPTPEVFGGSMHTRHLIPTGADSQDTKISASGVSRLALSALVETRGEQRQLRSKRLSALISDFIGEGYRWTRMPEALERRPEAVLPHGAANCICASLELERRCLAEGFTARTRRGWLLGMFDFDHTWLEVLDEDGDTKAIDCVFPLLGGMVRATNPQFAQTCLGSRMNRLLPTDYRADEPLARHECGGSEAPVKQKVGIRRSTAHPRRRPECH
jgi:hypothetical protein